MDYTFTVPRLFKLPLGPHDVDSDPGFPTQTVTLSRDPVTGIGMDYRRPDPNVLTLNRDTGRTRRSFLRFDRRRVSDTFFRSGPGPSPETQTYRWERALSPRTGGVYYSWFFDEFTYELLVINIEFRRTVDPETPYHQRETATFSTETIEGRHTVTRTMDWKKRPGVKMVVTLSLRLVQTEHS